MNNLLLRIAYEGTRYAGFQAQGNTRTVQGVLEEALEILHQKKVAFHAAGRTDAGVHATGQYINVHTDMQIATRFHYALNSYLPPDVRALSSRIVPPSFHARYSARKRHYTYTCYVGDIMTPQHRNFSVLLRNVGDVASMNADARCLVGEHDFRSFATLDVKEKSTVRRVFHASFSLEPPFLLFRISANGFLRKMVRSIVGTLLEYQRMRLRRGGAPRSFRRLLDAPQRSLAGPTAPPQGLCLSEVEFDEQ